MPALVQQMGEAYPELVRAEPLITETLKLEETRFRKTLERGLGLLDEASRDLEDGRRVPGDDRLQALRHLRLPARPDAGRPEAARHRRRHRAFDAAMEKQKEEARAAWKGSGEAATETVWFERQRAHRRHRVPRLRHRDRRGRGRRLLKDGKEVEDLKAGEEGALVLNQTPFYGESGGQVGDEGAHQGRRARRSASPTRRRSSATSSCTSARSRRAPSSRATPSSCDVDHERRTATRANHSATHLLHEALRQVLGTTWPRRARWWRPTACASTSRTPSR